MDTNTGGHNLGYRFGSFKKTAMVLLLSSFIAFARCYAFDIVYDMQCKVRDLDDGTILMPYFEDLEETDEVLRSRKTRFSDFSNDVRLLRQMKTCIGTNMGISVFVDRYPLEDNVDDVEQELERDWTGLTLMNGDLESLLWKSGYVEINNIYKISLELEKTTLFADSKDYRVTAQVEMIYNGNLIIGSVSIISPVLTAMCVNDVVERVRQWTKMFVEINWP